MSSIQLTIQGPVALVALNRPEKFNSFNREMALSLQQVLDDCAANDHIRAICITGTGRAFCAGQDIGELTGPNPPAMDEILSAHYNPIVRRIRALETPVLAAVNGVAAGAGANIALCCDVVVAATSAKFIQAFSKIGLVPDSGGTFTLPRLIGFQKASALMMLGDAVTATEAERIGMIYQVLPDENFIEASLQIAMRLAQLPTRALAYTKQALNASASNTLDEQLSTENDLQGKAAATNDFREGIQSFIEKRAPLFTGN